MIHYKGWIPTASQRLSFSFAGESQHPKPTIDRNIADDRSRYIISCQYRPDLLDSAIPFFKRILVRFFSNIVSDFWFICIARCDNKHAHVPLKGTLSLIKGKKPGSAVFAPAIQAIFEELDKFPVLKDKDPGMVLDNYVKENNIDDRRLAYRDVGSRAASRISRRGIEESGGARWLMNGRFCRIARLVVVFVVILAGG